MTKTKIGFIGAGNVSEAFIRGIITSGFCDPGQIFISDINKSRLEFIKKTLGVGIAKNNKENAEQSDLLFLAVKPAQILDVAKEIKNNLKNNYVISIAAGKSLDSIRKELNNYTKLCRIMPNLAANVRKSTISIFIDPKTTEDFSPLFSLLRSIGKIYIIKNETQMASITALSGSAPAYYVMMADALIKYGISQGIDKEIATDMILTTMEGSASWALNSKIDTTELWKKVITPGGTTEAGINYFIENKFIEIFIEGLNRATLKAKEMGDK